jgi:antitoxin component of MazEF toxin-antitoxin module
MHSMGTQPLSRINASKYSNMSDFLGDPVRSETVFTLEEKLSEIEAEEEDDRAMGREPPAELAEVSG